MAATRLIALHINKGKTIAQCLRDRTDYAQNPEKTEKGELVTGYECDPMTADEEFLLAKRQYLHITGRRQQNDVIAYQIRQSFKPGEITPEEANRVGYELGMRFTKGKHAFLVATHTDRAHIHNHIVFNSPRWIASENFVTSITPVLPFRRSVTSFVWSMGCPLLRRNHTKRVSNEPLIRSGTAFVMKSGRLSIRRF